MRAERRRGEERQRGEVGRRFRGIASWPACCSRSGAALGLVPGEERLHPQTNSLKDLSDDLHARKIATKMATIPTAVLISADRQSKPSAMVYTRVGDILVGT